MRAIGIHLNQCCQIPNPRPNLFFCWFQGPSLVEIHCVHRSTLGRWMAHTKLFTIKKNIVHRQWTSFGPSTQNLLLRPIAQTMYILYITHCASQMGKSVEVSMFFFRKRRKWRHRLCDWVKRNDLPTNKADLLRQICKRTPQGSSFQAH